MDINDPQKRYQKKLALTRWLLRQTKLKRETVEHLYRFMDGVLTLPKAIELNYNKDIHQLEEETMATVFLSHIERIRKAEGRKEGKEEGLEQSRQVLLQNLLERLQAKFGTIPQAYIDKLTKLDLSALIAPVTRINTAHALEDVFLTH